MLAAGALRLWMLAAEDEVLDGPRGWLADRLPAVDRWLACPRCAGFWIGGGVWAAWWWWPAATLAVLTPFALNVALLLGRRATDETLR